jgi:hypothetical protein
MPIPGQIFQSIWWNQQKVQTNNTGKGMLHDLLHKSTNSILCELISLLQKVNNKIQINESLSHRISTKSMEGLMGYNLS